MNCIKGYKPILYKDLQKSLCDAYEKSGKSLVDIASIIKVSSTGTVSTAINAKEDQIVSDKVLTSIFNVLGFPAFVVWSNGKRQYYVKSKN